MTIFENIYVSRNFYMRANIWLCIDDNDYDKHAYVRILCTVDLDKHLNNNNEQKKTLNFKSTTVF